jgi:hypothetical protein
LAAFFVRSTASSVELAPVPAMTGTRPFTAFTVCSMTFMCSAKSSVADSPVVPHGTMAWEPSAICHSMSFVNAL